LIFLRRHPAPDRARICIDRLQFGLAGLPAARPVDCVGLYFWCNPSGRRKRRGARPALVRQRGHGPASRGNLDRGRARRAPSPRSGGMEMSRRSFPSGQHHALAFPPKSPELNAIHARQLALKPHLQISRRHFGPLLLCPEQAYRHALENHVYRHSRLGLSVIINETWY
jgi:hypothetical protein